MANLNYFDPTSDEAPVAQDTASADASKGGVRKAWDAWTSKPENNAALLQFGIAMMQPRAQGQSSLGQIGASIGEAGDAATRNLAAQEAEKNQEAKRSEQESTAKYREAQSTAALQNAASYGRQVDNTPGGTGLARTTLSGQIRMQQGFRQWMQKTEDVTGLSQDPLLGAVQKEFPTIKTKADLISNPAAQKRAFQIYSAQLAEPPEDGGADPATAAPPTAPQPAKPGMAPTPGGGQGQVRTFYDKTTGAPVQWQWDGAQWTRLPQ